MKSTVAKIIRLLALAAGVAAGFSALSPSLVLAAAPTSSVSNFEIGIGTSTSFVQVTTSPGLLLDIFISSGSAGGFAVCFDSGSVTGLSTASDGTSTAPRLPSAFLVQVGTITIQQGVWPSSTPPIGFANGLACANSAAQRTNILYRIP